MAQKLKVGSGGIRNITYLWSQINTVTATNGMRCLQNYISVSYITKYIDWETKSIFWGRDGIAIQHSQLRNHYLENVKSYV